MTEPTASEWDRFLAPEGTPDEHDADREEEDEDEIRRS
jgi:hypothetical protein